MSTDLPMAASTPPIPLSYTFNYTICPVLAASNLAVLLGWFEEEFERVGASPVYLRSLANNAGWLPHFNHGYPDLFRDGGAIPPLHAKADGADTLLIGITWVRGRSGGEVIVRHDSDIITVDDLAGRKIGLYRSLNTAKGDFRRATEHRQLLEALRINHVTPEAVQWIDIDDDEAPRYLPARDPEAYIAQGRAFAARGDAVRDALAQGTVDVVYADTLHADAVVKAGTARSIENLSAHGDWRLEIANTPYLTTVSRSLAEARPEIVTAWLRAAVRAGRWANAHREKAASLFQNVLTAGNAAQIAGLIADADFVPSVSDDARAAVAEQKRFLVDHDYIEKDFDLDGWIDDRFLRAALASA